MKLIKLTHSIWSGSASHQQTTRPIHVNANQIQYVTTCINSLAGKMETLISFTGHAIHVAESEEVVIKILEGIREKLG